LAGRDFAHEAANATKVAIINRAFAEHFFPRQNPIGRRIVGAGVTYEVIGVVENIKSRTLGEDTRYVLFRSLAQSTESDPSFLGYQLLVHFRGNPTPIANAVRREVRNLDPALAVYNIQTMEQHLRQALFLPRLAGTLFGAFGFIGLVLAAIGLYGAMSYSVSRRTREIGIRIALGAQLSAVRGLILRQGMFLTVIALALGLPAAFALAGILSSFLYGIQPHDAMTFTVAPLFLAAVAFLACWIPAFRAASTDPQRALRYE
jgi:ABC-type antimicrobial peptide transport system permease subunit